MLVLNLNEKEVVGVEWNHRQREQNTGTLCVIHQLNDKLESVGAISDGRSFLVDGDNFNKEIGRKISLKRAMQKAQFSREERTQVWKDYFNR